MKQLEVALKFDAREQSRSTAGHSRVRSHGGGERWSLDPDLMQEGPQGSKQRFLHVTKDIFCKRYTNEKYLQEETFRQLLLQLTGYLSYVPSELHRLIRIEQTLQQLSESLLGQMKNYIKQFQGLLDARIRKLKKREKKIELLEFDRIAVKEGLMKRKNPVTYINEDDKPSRNYFKQTTHFESDNKRSFGTMNSGLSNENQSGSGKNKSASDSKSGEANALTVLFANIGKPQEKKNQRPKCNQRDSYNFSSVLSASIAVRQRSPVHKIQQASTINFENEVDSKVEPDIQSQKDEAFIFHCPKATRKGKC